MRTMSAVLRGVAPLVRRSLRQSTLLRCVCVAMGKRTQFTETDVLRYTTQKGDMFKYENTLPSLPVPPLAQTLERYLHSVRPLLTDQEFAKTQAVVKDFGQPGRVGEQLHRKLEEKARKSDNWLSDWWLDVAYLAYRLPVVIHVSPATVGPRLNIPDHETYIEQATRLLISITIMKVKIDAASLPVDKQGEVPLAMDQYPMLFSCNRIPGEKIDVQRRTPPEESLHAIVAHNGHFFKLQVLYPCPDGTLQIAPWDHLKQQIRGIIAASPHPAQHQVGVLTSEHRDNWYQARQTLIKDPLNRQTLDVIETAMFSLSLDKPHPYLTSLERGLPYSDAHTAILAHGSIHGNGTDMNTSNRWFDTSIQFFLSPDGALSTAMEHSAADGTTAIQVSNFAFKCCVTESLPALQCDVDPLQLQTFEQLKWNISPESEADLEKAKVNVSKLISKLDLQAFTFHTFGKRRIKACRLSPDAFMQMAVQLAYFRRHGKAAAVYESAATRRFKKGRTETIRSQSPECLAFCKAMCNSNSTAQEKMATLQAAVQYHTWYTKEAVNAQGVDRHLLGLKLIAGESGMETPSIYTDPAFARSVTHNLSTSQVAVVEDVFMCFGPTAEEGYGVCYNLKEDKIIFGITSFTTCPETNSLSLGATIMECLVDIQNLFPTSVKSKL